MLGVVHAALLVTCLAEGNVTVSFVVEAASPDSLPVCIAGSTPELGGWDDREALRLTEVEPGLWTGSTRVTRGVPFGFSIIRSRWEAEAMRPTGEPMGETWVEATRDTTIVVKVASWEDAFDPAAHVRGTLVSLGKVPSAHVPSARDVWVILPPSYSSAPHRRYPTLYVHDGQDCFASPLSSTGREWHLDEIVDSLVSAGRMREILIVPVASSAQRIYEYADTSLGKAYVRFLTEELKPRIDREFRTEPDRCHTALIGRGLGGTIALLAAWWRPEAIGACAALSPFLLWGDGKVVQSLEEPPAFRPRVWVGAGEDRAGGANPLTEVCATLRHHGWEPHDLWCESAPSRAFEKDLASALQYLFPAGAESPAVPTGVMP